MRTSLLLPFVTLLLPAPPAGPPVPAAARWGADGHRIVGAAAAAHLPEGLPAFVRRAGEQLAYLNYEPDRWRDRSLPAMDQAFQYDHYIDLENVPAPARQADNRFAYLATLYRSTTLEHPERDAGLLPWRILELHERLVTGFRRWRNSRDPSERSWIEQRILNDAGILGHYVADGSQPHHTTIHFNGWSPRAPNPRGYATARDLHRRFETDYVRAAIDPGDIVRRVPDAPHRLTDVRTAVWHYLDTTHRQVETLYALEQAVGFDPEHPRPRTTDFVSERLVAGATMLRDLWWTAWLDSAVR